MLPQLSVHFLHVPPRIDETPERSVNCNVLKLPLENVGPTMNRAIYICHQHHTITIHKDQTASLKRYSDSYDEITAMDQVRIIHALFFRCIVNRLCRADAHTASHSTALLGEAARNRTSKLQP